jgi:hypothetical protein
VVSGAGRALYDRVALAHGGESSLKLSPAVRLLLWDYARGSLAYDIAFVLVVALLLLVPGWFWGDPLWVR